MKTPQPAKQVEASVLLIVEAATRLRLLLLPPSGEIRAPLLLGIEQDDRFFHIARRCYARSSESRCKAVRHRTYLPILRRHYIPPARTRHCRRTFSTTNSGILFLPVHSTQRP